MKTISRLFQLTIARKLLLGFLSCGILGVLFALIALSNFQKLNEINNRIIERDVPLAETANEMVEALMGQDLCSRSLVLKSSDMEGLFWKRSNEFEMLQRKIAGLPVPALSLHRLATVHKEYNSLYEAEFDKKNISSSTSGDDQLMRGKREELFELLKGISQNARKDQNEKNLETRSIGDSAFWTVLGLSIGGLLLGIFIAVLITHNISGSIRLLEHSTREISEGKFNQVSQVRNQDELGDLSRAFQMMAQRLKQAEEEQGKTDSEPSGFSCEN